MMNTDNIPKNTYINFKPHPKEDQWVKIIKFGTDKKFVHDHIKHNVSITTSDIFEDLLLNKKMIDSDVKQVKKINREFVETWVKINHEGNLTLSGTPIRSIQSEEYFCHDISFTLKIKNEKSEDTNKFYKHTYKNIMNIEFHMVDKNSRDLITDTYRKKITLNVHVNELDTKQKNDDDTLFLNNLDNHITNFLKVMNPKAKFLDNLGKGKGTTNNTDEFNKINSVNYTRTKDCYPPRKKK